MEKVLKFGCVLMMVSTLAVTSCSGSDDSVPDNPNTCTKETFYLDSDGDGFGDPNSTKSECTQPNGYVKDKTDPDDGNALIFPGCEAKYFVDNDEDGFGDANGATSCVLLDGYVDNDDDLDDGNASITTCTEPMYFLDSDNDGYGDPSVPSCTQLEGYVMDNSDCNDQEQNMNPGIMLIYGRDFDEDGFPGDVDTVEVNACDIESVPNGYYLIWENLDCDDQDSYFGGVQFLMGKDADGDGYADQTTVLYVSECDFQYYYNDLQYVEVDYNNPIFDCNDNDAEVYPGSGC
ncbi:hypothetical protein [Flagellimonas nanhaiensis]|nr:hypothetical protein [Allomuricauda nanhaiensis]